MAYLGDGTTYKSINHETSELYYQNPGESAPSYRFLGIRTANSHTSKDQLHGILSRFTELAQLYNASPLGKDAPIDISYLFDKLKLMMSDHANDQKNLVSLIIDLKEKLDLEKRGEEAVADMSSNEALTLVMEAMEACLGEVGGEGNWEALVVEERERRMSAAYKEIVLRIGKARFEDLSEEEKRWARLFIWAGCGMHKEMNAVKWGAKRLEEWWLSEQAKLLGISLFISLSYYCFTVDVMLTI